MTIKGIIERILSNLTDRVDRSEGSFASDLTKAVAIEFLAQDNKIDNIIDMMDVEKLNGDNLTRFVFQRTGLSRKEPTYANGYVLLKGSPLAVLEKGFLVSSNLMNYEILEDTQLDLDGEIFVKVQAIQAGVAGNAIAESINSFPITIADVVSVRNVEDFDNGYEGESDEDLRKRYYEKLQNPGTSGNEAHYKIWAKEVNGVGDAKVIPLWNGNGTVKVVVVDGNKKGANEELIKDVVSHITSSMPIGAKLTVTSAVEHEISISATITLTGNRTISEVLDEYKKVISDYFSDASFNQAYISYAKLGSLLLNISGVGDYSNFKINGKAENVNLANEDTPVLKDVILEV